MTETVATDTGSPIDASPDSDWILQRGDSLGRYLVLDRVARGGMGEVVSAYDPKLDRRVALKLLSSRGGGREQRARWMREARALARLNHPHVLTVYDADEEGDLVFLAMELVAGESLQQWLRREPRSERAVIDVFLQAGRGLAAAHAAGLVHRDFKSANVMVADDGRVLVLDFGLARSLADREETVLSPEDLHPSLPYDLGGEGGALTGTGSILGTPAFMAPEQRWGGGVSPAADQYSFCAALLHALTGTLPGEGGESVETALNGLGSRLARILRRGLHPNPELRHPSMDALLVELARNPRQEIQLSVLGALLVLILLGGGIGLWQWKEAADALCGGAEGHFAEVWSPERQGRLPEGLKSAVRRGLRDYGKAWSAMFRQACDATHRHGIQTAEVLQLRRDCLDQRLREVDAVLDRLQDGWGKDAQPSRPPPALPPDVWTPLDRCADLRALQALTPPPGEAEARRRHREIQEGLANLRGLWAVGELDRGQVAAETLAREAQAFGHWPLTAEILLEQARFHAAAGRTEAAGDALAQTLLAAEAGGHERVAAESFLARTWLGLRRGDPAGAEVAARQAQAVLDRLDRPEGLRGKLEGLRRELEEGPPGRLTPGDRSPAASSAW